MDDARILLVEDVDLIARVYLTPLRRAGFTVDHARDGDTALRLVRSNVYEVLLLDLTLPDMSGLEVLAALRTLGTSAPPRVIVLTNLIDPSDTARSLELGATEVMLKNESSPEQILLRIRSLLV